MEPRGWRDMLSESTVRLCERHGMAGELDTLEELVGPLWNHVRGYKRQAAGKHVWLAFLLRTGRDQGLITTGEFYMMQHNLARWELA